jgi:undecaprenyl-diphosphatase
MTLLREMFRQARAVFRQRWWLWLIFLALLGVGVSALLNKDADWQHRCVVADNRFASALTYWGDFPRGWLILIAVLGLIGWRTGKRRIQIAALAALLAGSCGGIEAHTFSSLIGRPRPSVEVPDRLHGFTIDRAYKSFPSGHTTCAFAVAIALALTLPSLGIPAILVAALVAWSRMALNAHYPSDVWAGFWLGMFNALVFGLAARRCSVNVPSAGTTVKV